MIKRTKLKDRELPQYTRGEEIFNMVSHILGVPLGIVAIVLCAAQFNQPIIGVCIFFILVAIATGLLIYNGVYYSKESDEKKEVKENSLMKQISSIISIIGLIVYLFVSFMTMAWHITWMIWLIVALIDEIVKLIFIISSKKEEGNSNE